MGKKVQSLSRLYARWDLHDAYRASLWGDMYRAREFLISAIQHLDLDDTEDIRGKRKLEKKKQRQEEKHEESNILHFPSEAMFDQEEPDDRLIR